VTVVLDSISHIESTLSENDAPITLAFSGGKDSSALLCLVYTALLRLKSSVTRSVEVLYCDTKTENPIVDAFVKKFLRRLREEAREAGLALTVKVVSPASDRTYFARIIGRGYPPPTNSFRWCTKELRIRPVEKHLSKREDAIVALGVRQSESKQRDRVLASHQNPFWMAADNAKSNRIYYTPIRQLNTEDVWDVIFFSEYPKTLDRKSLWELYADAGGDCPIIRSPDSAPCASGRFGCWTCTVVRRDRSGENLANRGYAKMADFLEFRKLLLDIRNNRQMRWPVRRNGSKFLGPLTIEARSILLKSLRKIERRYAVRLLSEPEVRYIRAQWRNDRPIEANYRMYAKAKRSARSLSQR
jgi:DNA sulfur modification protein DndC